MVVGGSSSIALSGQLIPDRLWSKAFVSSALDLGESYLTTTRSIEILKIPAIAKKIHFAQTTKFPCCIVHRICTSEIVIRLLFHKVERKKEEWSLGWLHHPVRNDREGSKYSDRQYT